MDGYLYNLRKHDLEMFLSWFPISEDIHIIKLAELFSYDVTDDEKFVARVRAYGEEIDIIVPISKYDFERNEDLLRQVVNYIKEYCNRRQTSVMLKNKVARSNKDEFDT